MPPAAPSSQELLALLRQARDSLVASQAHWGAVQHLTGDRRNQRRHHEALLLLDAMIRDIEQMAKHFAKD
jgi:hypothetical protein